MGRRIIAVVLLLLAVCLLIAVPVLTLTPVGPRVLRLISPAPTPTPRPVLTVRGTPPVVQGTAVYVLDADTGNALVNVHGQQRLPMASTTKILTAIIAIEKGDPNMLVTVKQDSLDEVRVNNGSSAQLVVGDKIRLLDLLYGLMLPSGDDAAIAIADAVGGSSANFVAMMNSYAHRLHLNQTHYINPDGLTYKLPDGKPNLDHYTTAADLAHLTRYAMANSLFAQIVELQHYVLNPTTDHHAYTWDTTDTLLSFYPGATGVKTGFTVEAGYCLAFAATSSGHHLIGALLQGKDANQRFVDAKALLNWAFSLPLLPPPTPKPS